jgi:RNA repair, ligase-Pnkp-associating, region of Hen1
MIRTTRLHSSTAQLRGDSSIPVTTTMLQGNLLMTDRTSVSLEEYVNDRPYAASSFLSVAIARTFGTAITGKSKERQELADTPLPLEARITVLPCRGGENLLRRLFEPLLMHTCF